jgi:hypothetical protein
MAVRLASGRLLTAVVQTLTDLGPSPTAFGGSPAADFLCEGRLRRTAPGWWVAFATQLHITSAPADEERGELVVLRFHGARVHNGEAFSWGAVHGLTNAAPPPAS